MNRILTAQIKSRLIILVVLLSHLNLCKGLAGLSREIPKGEVFSFVWKNSKTFPGTLRKVFVYIPAGLDRKKPACVYVQQDGLDKQKRFPAILDTLISNGEIPMLVGVFITPGRVVYPDRSSLPRPNRSFEYDGLGDKYVRFLTEEILPEVEKRYGLHLSDNGNDRAIGGASSGGIAAFNAAWERPEAFARVYCNSGSFVDFRGGYKFPIFIRKTAPKPIRAFLTAGTDDMENCAGDWMLINLQMEKALKFSGYDFRFHLLEGRHVVGYGEYFAEAMKYIWNGWPAPVKAGKGAPRVRDILLPDKPWELVAEGFGNITDAACNEKGEVFFTDPVNKRIYKINDNGSITAFIKDTCTCTGLTVGPYNELYSISMKKGIIKQYDTLGHGVIFGRNIHGEYILARPDGRLYVSSGSLDKEEGKVWLVEKDKDPVILDRGLKQATGMAMSPDRWMLAVADGKSHWVYNYIISDDGKLTDKEPFFWLYVKDSDDDAGTGPVCYDQEGHLYAGTLYGVQVCAWDGATQVIMPLPARKVTGLSFGGRSMDILYAFCGDKIYRRKLKTHGFGAFTPKMKMTRGKL